MDGGSGIREQGHGEEAGKDQRMDGGAEGGREDDNRGGLQREDRNAGRQDRGRREEEEGGGRISKDRKVNKDGRSLVKLVEETGWEILNGSIEGDEEGEYTYTGGRGTTVIDYVVGDESTRMGVERMEVGDRVVSDHHPMVVTMREGGVGERRGKVRERKVGGGRWSARMKEEFMRGMEGSGHRRGGDTGGGE